MLSRDKILRETSPLSIFFVKSGSGGNRLLFRYPYDNSFYDSATLGAVEGPVSEQDIAQIRNMIEENDEALCNMFSVNPFLCGQKFEIKINSVRHVGHPMSLLNPNPPPSSISSVNQQHSHQKYALNHANKPSVSSYGCNSSNHGDVTSFNIVCALRTSASYDIVDSYHCLSKRLAIALSYEERRCSYLSKEIKTILATLDERDMANLTNQDQSNDANHAANNSNQNTLRFRTEGSRQAESVFATILERSNLAKDLRKIFISLSTTGVVDLKINNWLGVSFSLPQKVHRLKLLTHKSMPAISTTDIKRCLIYLRPYHGLLLLQEAQDLLDSLPIDASPAFIQLIKVTKPDKNFMDLSVDANLTLMQIFRIVSQLVYWGRATIIYPVCDSNVYAIHPLASTGLKSKLVDEFRSRFPSSKPLHHYLAEFSEGISLSQLNGPLLSMDEKLNLLNIVVWLLQRRVLIQIHKYVFLISEKATQTRTSSLGSVSKCTFPLASGRSSEDLKLLTRLTPYFDGKHHIEDMMFFENLERSQVLILCDKFRDILYTCHYEDVAVSQLCPFDSAR